MRNIRLRINIETHREQIALFFFCYIILYCLTILELVMSNEEIKEQIDMIVNFCKKCPAFSCGNCKNTDKLISLHNLLEEAE